MEQLDIFSVPVARHTDPATSHDAAHVARKNAKRTANLVLIAHARAGARGLTGAELADAIGIPYEKCGPRRPALERAGLLRKGDKRPNPDGNAVQVYVITAAGIEAAAALTAMEHAA